MDLVCNCGVFRSKSNVHADADSEVGGLLKKPEVLPVDQSLGKDDSFRIAWLVLAVAYIVPATLWVSLEVIDKYLIAGIDNPPEKWNSRLPYLGTTRLRACCMGLHFLCGSVMTVGGLWQVMPISHRPEWRFTHRIMGRIFVICTFLTAIGGGGFILQQQKLAGGYSMTMSFSLFAVTAVTCAALTFWYARQKDFAAHRRWAIRSFVLGIGSFEFRVLLYAGIKLGITTEYDTDENCSPDPDGTVPFFRDPWYNQFIAWFFFLGNLIFVEWYLRAQSTRLQQALLWAFLLLATVLLIAYTYWGIERLMKPKD